MLSDKNATRFQVDGPSRPSHRLLGELDPVPHSGRLAVGE